MASGGGTYMYVCSKCLDDHPGRVDLITHKCFAERGEHSGIPRVQVQWTERRRLKRINSASTPIASIQSSLTAGIRPMPRVDIPGKFMLCDRQRCKGETCTFAHSIDEQNAWNRQKNSTPMPWVRKRSPHAHDSKFKSAGSRRSRKVSEPIPSAGLPRSQQLQHLDFTESPRSYPRGPTNSLSQPEESVESWISYSTMLQRAQPQQYTYPSSALFTQPRERMYEHQFSEPAHSMASQVAVEQNQLSDPVYQSTERDPAFGYHLSDPVHSPLAATRQGAAHEYQYSNALYYFLPVSRKLERKEKSNHQADSLPMRVQPQLPSATEGSQPHSVSKDDWPDLFSEPLGVSTQPGTPLWSGSITTPESQCAVIATSHPQPEYSIPEQSLHEIATTKPNTNVNYAAKQPTFEKRRAQPLQSLHEIAAAKPNTNVNYATKQPTFEKRRAQPLQSLHEIAAAKPITNVNYAAKQPTFEKRRAQPLQIATIQQELTRHNYQEKFHNLLCWEEMAHIHILDHRCNGHYTMVLHEAGPKPSWLRYPKPFYKRFGYLLGLDGDQIAYATQASEGAVIVLESVEIKADILTENFHHADEKLYLAFNLENVKKLEIYYSVMRVYCEREVNVEFEVKHFYFNNLHKSLENLSPEIISRTMPERKDFEEIDPESFIIPISLRAALNLDSCSADQLNALKTVLSCPPNAPPVLIPGPFGTGKTQILATAAHYFILDSKRSGHPVHVLVCTQQQVSADTFLKCYLKVLAPRERDVQITRLTTEHSHRDPELSGWYKTVRDFKPRRSNSLIITTCHTSLHIAKMVQRGFFTHILLDEGAQMREPEGIAPLCMADKHTRIVIAGDQYQVGPAMLVLGDEAQENGLAVSLLERLQRQYSAMGAAASRYCATLVTNYRCHKDILKLVEKLFYVSSPLKCNVPRASTHPHARFPLRFVCSSIDDKVVTIMDSTHEEEAGIALEEAARFAKDWPEHVWGKQDLSQMCFMSSARNQVTLAGNLVKQMPHKLNGLRRHPTYDIQGREFRVLILSTTEHTWENGATRNPTKSICDPYVFNTAITRAQSLVVSVGNPFMLLKTEKHMIRKYGEKGKCWSQYLKTCLDHSSVSIHSSLDVSKLEEKECLEKLLGLVEEQLSRFPSDTEISETVNSGDFASEDTQSTETVEGSSSPHPKPGPHNLEQSSVKGDSRFERDYEVKRRLGKGGFGVVYRVKNKLDAVEYAIKLIKLPSSQSDQEKVLKEVRVLAKLNHERIVRYHSSWTEKAPPNWKERKLWSILESSSETSPWADRSSYTTTDDSSPPATPSPASSHSYSTDASVGAQKAEQEPSSSHSITFRDSSGTPKEAAQECPSSVVPQVAVLPTCLFIQTELCREENLKKWLQNHVHKRRRKIVMDIFSQILDGVCYIHKMGLIHRDLKPSNIFFSGAGAIKVGDFGLVTGSVAGAKSLTPPMGFGSSHSSLVGTFHYMSPEQLAGDRYNQKVDIYAMGVIFFELNCRLATQAERVKVLTDLRHATLPPTFVEYLPHEAAVVLSLLADNPSERPSAQEIADSDLLKQLKSTIENLSSKLKYVPEL